MNSEENLVNLLKKRNQNSQERHDFSADFETKMYPPVSLEKVHFTEETLCFKLVDLLSRIYTEVGNGGFGPGYGIFGIAGGHPDQDGRNLLEVYTYVQSIFVNRGWKKGILPICEWGSAIWSGIDCNAVEGNILTLHEEGIFVTPFNLKSWLKAWLEGISIWDQMFEFTTVLVSNPFTGTNVPFKKRTLTKGTRIL